MLAEQGIDWTTIIIFAILFGGIGLVARMWDSFCGIFKRGSKTKDTQTRNDYDEEF